MPKPEGNQYGLRHGAHSSTALAPRITSVRRAVCARMKVRQSELTWVAREQLDLYCRSRAKLLALDGYLERVPLINEDGEVAGCMKLYVAILNSNMRALEALRLTVGDMARHDDRYETALAALEAEQQ
jgi:hypothetical protein